MSKRKPKTAPQSILLLSPSLQQVGAIAKCLNTEFAEFAAPGAGGWGKARIDYRPIQKELKCLIQQWRDSGPNVAKLLDADPFLNSEISQFRAQLVPTRESFGKVAFDIEGKTLSVTDPLFAAVGLFLDFLLNPFNVRLAGPCKHCGKYFVRESDHGRKFCGKACGHSHTALQAMKKQRDREYAEKLRNIRKSVLEWKRKKTSHDWKDWVARDTRISKNWITRAIKRGNIILPV